MAIYIQGMEMPDEGLYYIQDGYIHKYKGGGGTVRAYKIAEVPEPHGRLIDADVILEAIRTDIMGGLNYERFIRETPTTIERSNNE